MARSDTRPVNIEMHRDVVALHAGAEIEVGVEIAHQRHLTLFEGGTLAKADVVHRTGEPYPPAHRGIEATATYEDPVGRFNCDVELVGRRASTCGHPQAARRQ